MINLIELEEGTENKLTFQALYTGELFKFNGSLYLKTSDSESHNAFNFSQNTMATISSDGAIFTKVKGKLTFKEIYCVSQHNQL